MFLSQGSKYGTRVLRFVVGFIADRDLAREAECDTFAEKLLSCLVSLVTVEDKIVRTRCCQLVSAIFQHMSAEEVDDELLTKLEETMLLRLEDKVPDVRAHAVKTLSRFCNPGDVCLTPFVFDVAFNTKHVYGSHQQHQAADVAEVHRRCATLASEAPCSYMSFLHDTSCMSGKQ